MNAAVLVLLVGSALAAPTEEVKTNVIEATRTKKSAYGPPCSGGSMSPVALYLSAQPGPEQHYRENEHHEKTKEEARSYYDSPAAGMGAASAAGALSGSGGALSGSAGLAGLGAGGGPGPDAVGVFPSANIGGCAIPLLLSCAPNVVSGHLSHAPAHHAAYPAYKASEVEAQTHNHMKDHMKKSDAQSAASETLEKQSMMEDPELESQTLFHHSRPMGMGFMHSHHGMMDFPHHFGHGHGHF